MKAILIDTLCQLFDRNEDNIKMCLIQRPHAAIAVSTNHPGNQAVIAALMPVTDFGQGSDTIQAEPKRQSLSVNAHLSSSMAISSTRKVWSCIEMNQYSAVASASPTLCILSISCFANLILLGEIVSILRKRSSVDTVCQNQ